MDDKNIDMDEKLRICNAIAMGMQAMIEVLQLEPTVH